MDALVEDMLALARQGEGIDETEPVTLSTLAEECWSNVDTADASLVVGEDLRFRADRSRLRQALENLIANAVTHGGDAVTVEVGALADGRGFYLADDGPGIPAELHEEAFAAGVSTDPDGTGFGLKIVAEVADAHGWSLSLADDAEGARFEFRGVDSAAPVTERAE
jgi:signal transduction histidine kinase